MSARAPSRVVLHVGAPKSGTTFLQDALWRRKRELAEAGVVCPGPNAREMFRAAVEVRGTSAKWGYDAADLAGTWRRLCEEAREHPGTTVMSHELLAAATEEQIAAALAELSGVDLHIVVTVRDLGRQVMSDWQERVKNGSTQSFRKFRSTLSRDIREGDFTGLFWRYQHVHGVLSRWGAGLPRENLHVVVAPRSGSDPLELWRRFGSAVGFDAAAIEPGVSGRAANPTLGVVQIAILRRVNKALAGRIPQPGYARFVKHQFSQGLLPRHSSPRPICPEPLVADLRRVADQWIEEIRASGYTVHGDLAELVPGDPPADGAAPDSVDATEEAAAAAAVIADLLVDRAERGAQNRRPRPAEGRPAPAATPPPQPAGRRARAIVRTLSRRR